MITEICWISNAEHAQMYKTFFGKINNKNNSVVISMLIFLKIAQNWTSYPETWSAEIEKLKQNVQEHIYRANPAEELYLCKINNFIWTFFPAIILFFGSVGNILSFIVLCNFTGKTVSAFIYLSLLALVDQFVLIVSLLRKWIDYLLLSKIENKHKILCKLSQFFGSSASDLSVWLIVAVTLERALVISFPFQAQNLVKRSRAILLTTMMALMIIFLNSHFIYTADLVIRPFGDSTNSSICGISERFTYFKSIWIVIDATVYSFLPFIFIMILNVIILVKVCQARKTRQSMVTVKNDHQNVHRSEGHRQLTVMLLMISGTFLATTTPIFIVKMIFVIPKYIPGFTIKGEPSIKDVAASQFANSVADLLMHLNHAMNFYLYCASGNKFRACLKSLFRKSSLMKCIFNSIDGTTGGQNSLFGNSMKVTRNVHYETRILNDQDTLHLDRNTLNL